MSVHLVQCAAAVELDNPRLKIALLCFAESGQGDDRIAKPGFGEVQKWLGVGKSQVHNLINRLIELRLIARHAAGWRGHRAEYVVFPDGCCEVHGKRRAVVVPDAGDVLEFDGNGSDQVGPFALSTASGQLVDPIAEKGSTLATERVHSGDGKGPLSERKIGALQEHYSQDRSPTGTSPAVPLTRETSDGQSIRFDVDPEPATGVRYRTPAGQIVGCRHCDEGWITDADGLPIEHCPHCHPARRQVTA